MPTNDLTALRECVRGALNKYKQALKDASVTTTDDAVHLNLEISIAQVSAAKRVLHMDD
jgi:hypothetical protein